MATVELTPQADAQFQALPRGIRPRVARLLDRLEQWPDVSGASRAGSPRRHSAGNAEPHRTSEAFAEPEYVRQGTSRLGSRRSETTTKSQP